VTVCFGNPPLKPVAAVSGRKSGSVGVLRKEFPGKRIFSRRAGIGEEREREATVWVGLEYSVFNCCF